MAQAKKTTKKTATKAPAKKASANPVGRPKKKYGSETLMDHKKSFKRDENGVVFDKVIDALILMAVGLIVACIVLFFFIKP